MRIHLTNIIAKSPLETDTHSLSTDWSKNSNDRFNGEEKANEIAWKKNKHMT